jgi:putative oxidoreductase
MTQTKTIVRIVLGLLIAISGINKFGHWINVAYMQDAMDFVLRLINIGGGFIIKTIAVVEILIGIALLTNRFTYLALAALLPLIVSIILFHIFLDLKGIGIAILVFLLDGYLLYMNKASLASLVKSK